MKENSKIVPKKKSVLYIEQTSCTLDACFTRRQ